MPRGEVCQYVRRAGMPGGELCQDGSFARRAMPGGNICQQGSYTRKGALGVMSVDKLCKEVWYVSKAAKSGVERFQGARYDRRGPTTG